MMKVSLMYPLTLGERFDMDYYCDTHIPLVKKLLGSSCTSITVDQCLVGFDLTSPAPYVAVCHVYFESPEEFKMAYAASSAEIKLDRAGYTDIEPIIMFSRVRV